MNMQWPNSPWDADTEAELKRLFLQEKLRPSEIARRMGLTNNQIAGRIARLGLPKMDGGARKLDKVQGSWRRRPMKRAAPLPEPDEPGTVYVRPSPYEPVVKVRLATARQVSAPRPKAPEPPRVFGRVTKCAAIVGRFVSLEDDGTCGEATVPGKSYCQEHHAAFTSPIGPLRPQKWMK